MTRKLGWKEEGTHQIGDRATYPPVAARGCCGSDGGVVDPSQGHSRLALIQPVALARVEQTSQGAAVNPHGGVKDRKKLAVVSIKGGTAHSRYVCPHPPPFTPEHISSASWLPRRLWSALL